jgi:CBS domain-containing protein
VVIPGESSVEYAAGMMRDNNMGMIPVGDKERISGVITDRDIAIRVATKHKNPRHTTVHEVMTPAGSYCFEDQDVEDACFMMEDKHVRRLLVLDRHTALLAFCPWMMSPLEAEKISSKIGRIAHA